MAPASSSSKAASCSAVKESRKREYSEQEIHPYLRKFIFGNTFGNIIMVLIAHSQAMKPIR